MASAEVRKSREPAHTAWGLALLFQLAMPKVPLLATRWYVLHSKPYREEALWQQALAQGFEAFYPRLQVKPANPRARKIRPYFPGYLFVHVDVDEVGLSTFQWMPCAIGLVCFGGVPAHVPDTLVVAIQRRLEEVNAAGGGLFYRLKSGDPVVIQDGPFAGYQAIFDARLGGKDRVRVLLKMLNERRVPMKLRAAQIKPAPK
jgi:transcriptional antiterminator RfaH